LEWPARSLKSSLPQGRFRPRSTCFDTSLTSSFAYLGPMLLSRYPAASRRLVPSCCGLCGHLAVRYSLKLGCSVTTRVFTRYFATNRAKRWRRRRTMRDCPAIVGPLEKCSLVGDLSSSGIRQDGFRSLGAAPPRESSQTQLRPFFDRFSSVDLVTPSGCCLCGLLIFGARTRPQCQRSSLHLCLLCHLIRLTRHLSFLNSHVFGALNG